MNLAQVQELAQDIVKKHASTQVEGREDMVCPRCGVNELHKHLVLNPLSRYAKAYICRGCGMDEAFSGELPLEYWWAVRARTRFK